MEFQDVKSKIKKFCEEYIELYDSAYVTVEFRVHGIEKSEDYLKLWGRLENAYYACEKVILWDYGDDFNQLNDIVEIISSNVCKAMPIDSDLAKMIPATNCFLKYKESHRKLSHKISEMQRFMIKLENEQENQN